MMKEIQNSIRLGMDLFDIALNAETTEEISLSVKRKKIIASFHQAACALDWLGLDGVPALLQLMQSAVVIIFENIHQIDAGIKASFLHCGYALLRHLSVLSFGYQISTIRLFPCYRDLYKELKKGNASPAVLLSLSIIDSSFSEFQIINKNDSKDKNTENLRTQFEQAFLIFLQGRTIQNNL